MRTPVSSTVHLGGNFGSVMTGLVEEEAARRADDNDDRTESQAEQDIKDELQDAAGLSRGIVNSILRGEIDCPFTNENAFPTLDDRLEVFAAWADIVGSTQDELVTAAEEDGCSYSESEEQSTAPRFTLTIH